MRRELSRSRETRAATYALRLGHSKREGVRSHAPRGTPSVALIIFNKEQRQQGFSRCVIMGSIWKLIGSAAKQRKMQGCFFD
jgi:hypothetical protein